VPMEEPDPQAGGNDEAGGAIVSVEPPPQKRRRRRKPVPWLDAQTEIPGEEYNDSLAIVHTQPVDYRRPLPHASPIFGLTTTIASIAPNIMGPFLAAPVLGDRRRAAMAGIGMPSARPPRGDQHDGTAGDEPMAPAPATRITALEPGSALRNAVAEAGLPPEPQSQSSVHQPILDLPSHVDWRQQQQLQGAAATGSLAGLSHPHAEAVASTSTVIHGTELPPLDLPFQESQHLSPWAPLNDGGNEMDLVQVPEDIAKVQPSSRLPLALPESAAETQSLASMEHGATGASSSQTGHIAALHDGSNMHVSHSAQLVAGEPRADGEGIAEYTAVARQQDAEIHEALGDGDAAAASLMDLCENPPGGAEAAACRFVHLLALHMQGTVTLEQTEPFADIAIGRGPQW